MLERLIIVYLQENYNQWHYKMPFFSHSVTGAYYMDTYPNLI